jgi:hypothetical protein
VSVTRPILDAASAKMLCHNTRDELFGLLDALLNETISQEQFRRLEAILLAEAEARQIFRQYLKLHQQLRTLAQAWAEEKLVQLAEGPIPEAPSPATPGQLGQGVVYGLLIALGLAVLAGALWFRHIQAETTSPDRVCTHPAAQIGLVQDVSNFTSLPCESPR